jgi:hypothetical protein
VQQFAAHYITNLSWQVVPLVGRKCLIDDWRDRTFDVQHFAPNSDIGIKSVGGLVVLDDDFDVPQVGCADDLLPATGAVYGRESYPRRKRLYVCPELLEPVVLKDLDGKTVLELRVNHQDMAPPSIHPDTGERLRWDGLLLPPAQLSRDHLLDLARLYYTARLLGRHWPENGRHDLRLACASFLMNALGLSELYAQRVLEWACRIGGCDSSGIRDVATAIRSTKHRLDAKAPATGGPTLARLLPDNNTGRRLITALRKAFGKNDAIEARIADLNERYYVVDVGSQTVVGEDVPRDNWIDMEFRTFADFEKKLIKEKVSVGTSKDGAPILKALASIWLHHPQGTQYDRLVFAPPGSPVRAGARDLNGWRGFTVEPAAGDWSLTRDRLLFEVMCGSRQDHFEWLLDWVAEMMQAPGRHGETSLVGIGPQGVGKNVVGNLLLARTFDGRHARVTTHIRQVLGEFNDILSGLCFLVLDEVGLTSANDYNAMKGLITGHTIDINRKGIRVCSEPSMLHVMFLSNLDTPLSVAADDRRFAFFQFADTYQNNARFFAAVAEELDAKGGRAAMLYDLLARKVDRDRLRLAPDSELKQASKRQSWTAAQWFLYRELREHHADWSNHGENRRIKKAEWAGAFEAYARQTNRLESLRDGHVELRKALKKTCPPEWDFNRPVWDGVSTTRDCWTLPPWETFRGWLEVSLGCSLEDLDEGMEEAGDVPF